MVVHSLNLRIIISETFLINVFFKFSLKSFRPRAQGHRRQTGASDSRARRRGERVHL